jgi:DMSO reductase anchor subunit
MQPNIASTLFYSLLFAMGGAPTLAMLIIQSQPHDPQLLYQIFIGLSVMIACVLVPLVLAQNGYLYYKRKDHVLNAKIKPLMQFYLVLNVLCLAYWLIYQFT